MTVRPPAAHHGHQVHTGHFADVHGNRSYVNISVAIDPETAENGPLGVFPVSPRPPQLNWGPSFSSLVTS